MLNNASNVVDFPIKNRQIDNPHPHTINRGDGPMQKTDPDKVSSKPIVKITLLNYDAAMQETYSQKFMFPLIEGLIKRNQLAQAK